MLGQGHLTRRRRWCRRARRLLTWQRGARGRHRRGRGAARGPVRGPSTTDGARRGIGRGDGCHPWEEVVPSRPEREDHRIVLLVVIGQDLGLAADIVGPRGLGGECLGRLRLRMTVVLGPGRMTGRRRVVFVDGDDRVKVGSSIIIVIVVVIIIEAEDKVRGCGQVVCPRRRRHR